MIMKEKDKERKIAFVGDWINRAWTDEEKDDRREFYGKSGIRVFWEEYNEM